MTDRIAMVPGTPLLIPEIAAGAAPELADVRQASLERVAWAARAAGTITVLAQDPQASVLSLTHLDDVVNLHPLGLSAGVNAAEPDGLAHRRKSPPSMSGSDLPVAVLVAAWLAAAAGVTIDEVWSVPSDPGRVALPARIAESEGLLLIADGTSTRTPKAPGSFVDGAEEFDTAVTEALRSVDAAFFLDARRATDAQRFGVQGLGAWAAAATIVTTSSSTWSGEVDLVVDPFGVCYTVAAWRA
jgi:hypothetical protein